MKIAGLLTMFIALCAVPIASAYNYRYADNSVDPNLVPRVHFVTNEERKEQEFRREEQELRRLLIERLKQENQTYARNEQIQPQNAKGHSPAQGIMKKIKEMPWWWWGIVGFFCLWILGKFTDE